jgi:hypothetical protein
MIRRFVYLLLVAVTLQLSWGTVSAYCEHESGRAARHFGHHGHDAPASDAGGLATGEPGADHAGDAPGAPKKASPHTHCSSCSHAALAVIALDGGLAHPRPIAIAPPAPVIHISSAYSAPPERPQWLHAA